MTTLQKTITQIETKIALENVLMQQQFRLIKNNLKSPQLIITALFASFTMGYLLSRKKSVVGMVRRLAQSAVGLYGFYRRIKLFLPMG